MSEIEVVERDLGDVDSYVEVEGKDADTATLLLDAAEKAKLPVEVVQTTSDGFRVPAAVAKSAGVEYTEADTATEVAEPKQATKKAPAKKAAAKKAPAKKKAAAKAKGA